MHGDIKEVNKMTPKIGMLLILALFPISLAAMFVFAQELSTRLAVWFASGWLMSQWMHVMLFVSKDRVAAKTEETFLQIAYFYRAKWWFILLAGIVIGVILVYILLYLCRNIENIRIHWVLFVVGVAIGLSQLSGSSIPKFGGEISMAALFIIGLILNRFFLTYAPGSNPPLHQMQSDALTSFGLIVALLSLWWPCAVQFGKFLFESYFARQPQMAQFQMTRYGGYICWMLVGIGLMVWKSLELLINARGGKYLGQ